MKKLDRVWGVIVAGVGGQGAVTVAQLVLGAAWRSKLFCLQSEVHGMSQRGGAVNAHILFDSEPVTSPTIVEGGADLLISMEPLETLRYLSMLKPNARIITSLSPIKNMSSYPDENKIITELNKLPNVLTIDTDKLSKELNNRQAANMILLGAASKSLPLEPTIWKQVIAERFKNSGPEIIEKNYQAFDVGNGL